MRRSRTRGSAGAALPWRILLVAVLIPGAASAQTEDEERIRALRAASNAAIARHDVDGILSVLDDAFHVTAGGGAMFDGGEAMGAVFAELFETFPDIVYVRTPETIEVGASGMAASERGAWVGTWTAPGGPVRTGGHYSAYWRRDGDAWRLRAEIFVTLFCEGTGCS